MGRRGNDAGGGPPGTDVGARVASGQGVRWKRLRTAGAVLVGVRSFSSLFSVYQIWMNPFGFSDLTQRYTQDISNLLITGPYLYPQTGPRCDVRGAGRGQHAGQSCRCPGPGAMARRHARWTRCSPNTPRAVIVDMLFVDPRKDDTLPELIGEIGRYKAAGVPLYFAGATDLPPARRRCARN